MHSYRDVYENEVELITADLSTTQPGFRYLSADFLVLDSDMASRACLTKDTQSVDRQTGSYFL